MEAFNAAFVLILHARTTVGNLVRIAGTCNAVRMITDLKEIVE